MPEYHFTGTSPRVLTGLSQGVNAWLTSPNGYVPIYGATLEAETGDVIHTDEPYIHPELEEVEATGGLVPNSAGSDTIPVPVDQGYVLPLGDTSGIDVLRAAADAAAPAVDPAHDAMTAEGAPAPAEPTN